MLENIYLIKTEVMKELGNKNTQHIGNKEQSGKVNLLA